MKKTIIAIIFAAMFSSALAQDHLNVMTFNIRYDNPQDSLDNWKFRKDHVASQLIFHEIHIAGVQEALHHQVQDLRQRLAAYKCIGVGREDGKEKGEYSAIYIDSTRLEVLQNETFWLAEKTNVPGMKGWDAAITRIVTWAKLRDKKTMKVFFVFNTHFDHMGKIARRESARLLIQKVKEIGNEFPCIITGDFNAKPDDEPIRIIVDKSDDRHLSDSKELSLTPHYGPNGTFNGFRSKETDDQPIDYIFTRNAVKVLKHATLSQTWAGRFSSDHFPVFARVQIN